MFNLINSRRNYTYALRESNPRLKSPYAQSVHNSILEFVGNTPLIKLQKIPKDHGLSCEIYAKCEFMNPAGSSKDRIALAMLKDAEKAGYISEKTQFVEPTSGNTGIGVAFNASLIDKKSYIVTGVKNSSEKINTMKLLGADVIVTRKSEVQIAREIKDAHPDTIVMLDQFENNVNPKIHYETTGPEIVDALGEIDMFVAGAGTGGTVTGAGYRIKETSPHCTIIVAEPDGSTMFNVNGKKHPFLVEGIGGSSVPIVLDKSVVDDFEVVTDEESFLMAREIIKKEGLLCGGSSGAAMAAAVKAIRKRNLGSGKKVVVILPDGIRNYMDKFVVDQWMEAHLFMDPPEYTMRWWKNPVTDLQLTRRYPVIETTCTCTEAIKDMKDVNIAIVVDKKGFFVGAISKDNLLHVAANPTKLPRQNSEEFEFNDLVTDHLIQDCYTLATNGKKGMPTIGLLSRMLDITQFVVIGKTIQENFGDNFHPDGVVTAEEVLNYIVTHNKSY